MTQADSTPGALRFVELLGPAGSGKSTVSGMLRARDASIAGMPTLRRRGYRGLAAASLVAALATLVRSRAIARDGRRQQVSMMAYLQTMPRILAGSAGADVIVFDQGPLFFLTRPSLMQERLAKWRSRMLDTWAPLLDLIVLLDAPDALLRERINTRGKWHALKGADGSSALEGLRFSRQVYERVIDEIAERPGGPSVLRIDTSLCSAAEIADAILADIARGAAGAGRTAHAEPIRPTGQQ